MKKLELILLGLVSILTVSQNDSADILIEPVVGYSWAQSEAKLEVPADPTQNNTAKDALNGMSYGGRVGYQTLGFQFGLDYLASKTESDGADINTNAIAGFIGYEFPVLFRVYGGYVFSGVLTSDSDQSSQDFELSGAKGPKVGIGFSLLSFLDLNLEYRSIQYDEEKLLDGAAILNAKSNAVMLALSFPITF